MKIAVYALCVVLPSLCVCTPLPDYSVAANSGSGAHVTTTGSPTSPTNVSANSNSNANVNINTPPAVPPTMPCTSTPPATGPSTTVDTSSNSNVNVNQQGPPSPGGGPSTTVDANSNSNVNVNQQGPPAPGGGPSTTVDANSNSNASVHQQGSGPGGSTDVNASSNANASVTVSGNKCGKPDTDGFNNISVLVKNQGDIEKFANGNWMLWKSSQATMKIETQEAVCAPRYFDQQCKASQYKITVKSETDILYEVWGYNGQEILYIKQTLDISSQKFHIYTSKVITVAKAASGSQEVIAVQNDQSIKQFFDDGTFAILDTDYENYMICTTKGQNSVVFISLSQKVYESVDLKQQVSGKIDQVLQTNNLSSTSFIEVTNKFEVDINQYKWDQCGQGGNTNVDANANSSSSVDVKNGGPSGSTNVKAGSDSSAKVDVVDNGQGGSNVHADANSNANVSVNGQGGGGSGNRGKPTQQGFTNYSVLKVSNDEFKSSIDKTTWHVAKYTENTEQVQTDVTVCADRYICSSCKNVKFQYVTDKNGFVLKEWGYDGTNLLYIQETISFSTQDFVILKAEVKNVMKATKDTDVAVGVENKDQVKSYLSSEYAVLGTDYKNYFIGQTSCEKGSITFIAFIEEIYLSEEKQQKFSQEISVILKESGIDESTLKILSQKFDVDTNKYNKSKKKPDDSGAGQPPCPPSPGGSNVDASASSNSSVDVNNNTSGPPASPTPSSVNVDTSSNSNASVNTTPSAQPPASPTPSSVNVDASSNSNASVNTTGGGPTTVDASSNSDANVHVTTP